jgi:hypothetical protein
VYLLVLELDNRTELNSAVEVGVGDGVEVSLASKREVTNLTLVGLLRDSILVALSRVGDSIDGSIEESVSDSLAIIPFTSFLRLVYVARLNAASTPTITVKVVNPHSAQYHLRSRLRLETSCSDDFSAISLGASIAENPIGSSNSSDPTNISFVSLVTLAGEVL